MFSNYGPGVRTSQNGCGCHTGTPPIITQGSPANATTDNYGNITKLQWAPTARFTINITSDEWVPIKEGSKVFNVSGVTPAGVPGYDGLYAYNTVDGKCWKYSVTQWEEEPEIVYFPNSDTVVLFSNANCVTKVSIKNFRGEPIFTAEDDDTSVELTVDDALANILMQGYYNMDVYQSTSTSTRLVRRIPLSISYSEQNNNQQSFPSVGNSCHSGAANFATDNSLILKNGVLSVNTAGNCSYGNSLPVSSGTVYEYAQPRNLIVDVSSSNGVSDITAIDIYNYANSGGTVYCLNDGMYLNYVYGTTSIAVFNLLDADDNVLSSYTATVDAIGKTSVSVDKYDLSGLSSIASIKEELIGKIEAVQFQHNEDITSINETITSIDNSISLINGRVSSITAVSNDVAKRMNVLEKSMSDINSAGYATAEEVNSVVTSKVNEVTTSEEFRQMIEEAVKDNVVMDGGEEVIE